MLSRLLYPIDVRHACFSGPRASGADVLWPCGGLLRPRWEGRKIPWRAIWSKVRRRRPRLVKRAASSAPDRSKVFPTFRRFRSTAYENRWRKPLPPEPWCACHSLDYA